MKTTIIYFCLFILSTSCIPYAAYALSSDGVCATVRQVSELQDRAFLRNGASSWVKIQDLPNTQTVDAGWLHNVVTITADQSSMEIKILDTAKFNELGSACATSDVKESHSKMIESYKVAACEVIAAAKVLQNGTFSSDSRAGREGIVESLDNASDNLLNGSYVSNVIPVPGTNQKVVGIYEAYQRIKKVRDSVKGTFFLPLLRSSMVTNDLIPAAKTLVAAVHQMGAKVICK